MNHIFMISRLAGSRQSFQKGTNDKNAAPIHVISTEAKRSGEIYFLQWYMKHGEGRSLDSEYHQRVFHLPHTGMQPRSR